MPTKLALPAFVILTLAIGVVIGMSFPPGEWYAGLSKPFFNPPNWLFGPVWTVLYIMIGYAGWRVWMVVGNRRLRRLWTLQMVQNLLWSPAMFGAQSPLLGLLVIVPLLLVILAFTRRAWRRDRQSALLFLPYAAWVGFATLLNAAIWWLN